MILDTLKIKEVLEIYFSNGRFIQRIKNTEERKPNKKVMQTE